MPTAKNGFQILNLAKYTVATRTPQKTCISKIKVPVF